MTIGPATTCSDEFPCGASPRVAVRSRIILEMWTSGARTIGGKEPTMLIIDCDYHPGFQQIACVDTESGELTERRLAHREQAEQFYRELKQRSVRVGMEASGHARWFECLLAELQFELWIGNAAEIRTQRVRKQKTDRQDAQLLLRLLIEDRFPRIWVPDSENRDLRQLLWHPPSAPD